MALDQKLFGVVMARVVAALLLLLFGSASLATAQFRPDRIRVSEGVMQALLIKKVGPQTPPDSVRVRGEVVLKAVIDKTGSIDRVELISGHPVLVPAAIDAVKRGSISPICATART
jgi:TonB-like protein